ncbi:MAG: hypothetical protein PHZ19_10510 [Candidatus Thermoplasmatota archaeon]|nr:hypothetical protein [Candidatus Thermoplasmatota archaeon]
MKKWTMTKAESDRLHLRDWAEMEAEANALHVGDRVAGVGPEECPCHYGARVEFIDRDRGNAMIVDDYGNRYLVLIAGLTKVDEMPSKGKWWKVDEEVRIG